jgi:hypothetical protein
VISNYEWGKAWGKRRWSVLWHLTLRHLRMSRKSCRDEHSRLEFKHVVLGIRVRRFAVVHTRLIDLLLSNITTLLKMHTLHSVKNDKHLEAC